MQKHVNDVSNFFIVLFVGATIGRPRTCNARPYTGFKKPYAARLICLLPQLQLQRRQSTNYGVVTRADESHHLYVKEA